MKCQALFSVKIKKNVTLIFVNCSFCLEGANVNETEKCRLIVLQEAE